MTDTAATAGGATTIPEGTADLTPEQIAELQRQLDAIVAKTGPVRKDVERAPSYNHPNRLAAHPMTGDIVELAGDPSAVDLYAQKGFHFLSREEVRQWRTIRPVVVAEQRRRARLMTNLRRMERDDPTHTLKLNEDMYPLDDYPTAELEEIEAKWREITGGKVISLTGPSVETAAVAARRRMEEADAASEAARVRDVEMGSGDRLRGNLARSNASGRPSRSG